MLQSTCGDGTVDLGEQCDDGNAVDEDGCTNQCRQARCGDGILHAQAGETCDDGNFDNGDGCDTDCQVIAAAGSRCPGIVIDLAPGPTRILTGSLTSASADYTGSCGSSGNDIVYRVQPAVNGSLRSVLKAADGALYSRVGACATGTELQCSNVADGVATIEHAVVEATQNYIVVDNGGAGAGFALELTLTPDVVCDGEGEACQTSEAGVCKAGTLVCVGSVLECRSNATAQAEVCGDVLDNDCDGVVDNGCACAHDKCDAGVALSSTCDPCVQQICDADEFCCSPTGAWDDACIAKVAALCRTLVCDASKQNCAHSLCRVGQALTPGCDSLVPLLDGCASAVCDLDPQCCVGGGGPPFWDSSCVQNAQTVCSVSCE